MEEDLERYEAEAELRLYSEYRDVLKVFRYAIDTERRFYLANQVTVVPRDTPGGTYLDVEIEDAWVWDVHRPNRFVKKVRVTTFGDVNIEELEAQNLEAQNLESRELPPPI